MRHTSTTVANGMTVLALAVIALSLGACSGSGGGASSSSSTDSEFFVDPATANPPYSIAPSDDLALYYCHVHQDFYADPTHFDFWWGIKSTFATDLHDVEWIIQRLDGPAQPVASGTIATLPANASGGDGHTYTCPWTEQAPGGRHSYALTIDPRHRIAETRTSNNTYVFIVDVPATSTPSVADDLEFYAREAHFHAMVPGAMYIVHFEVRNTKSILVPPTKWRLTCAALGIDQTLDLDQIPAGGVVETEQSIHITTPGTYEVTVTIDSTNLVSESREDDNTRTFVILVGAAGGAG